MLTMPMSLGGNEVVLFFVTVAIYLVVIEVSFRLGVRNRDETDVDAKGHITALQSALPGLLALLLIEP